ncbi:MAG: hypothetical protein U9R58_07560 [Chloroflexota bacterium]|nr:hypothetical protein [Chloroflexota bacterium]
MHGLHFFRLIFVFFVLITGCSGVNADESTPAVTRTIAEAGSDHVLEPVNLIYPAVKVTNNPDLVNTPLSASSTRQPSPAISQQNLHQTATSASETGPQPAVTPIKKPDTENGNRLPYAPLHIISPGGSSRVIPPIELSAELFQNDAAYLIIELRGSDGRLLVRHLLAPIAESEIPVSLVLDINYGIPNHTENGRLLLLTKDHQGRWIDVNSVNLRLFDSGVAEIYPAVSNKGAITIQEPFAASVIEGGSVFVSGLAYAGVNGPLRVQLVSDRGKVVGQRLAGISTNVSEGYLRFSVEVPYEVKGMTPVRLVVYEGGGIVSEIAHLSSVELSLKP